MVTQLQRVTKKLLATGYITRNECLRQVPCISRLSGIIQRLEEEGWQFETDSDNKDYKYTVTHCPLKKTIYQVGEKKIETYK